VDYVIQTTVRIEPTKHSKINNKAQETQADTAQQNETQQART